MGYDEDTTVVGEAVAPHRPRSRRGRRACLVVLAGPASGELFPLDGEQVLGRSEAATVRILDGQISRRHARIAERGGSLWIEDMGSTNGTFVNDEPVFAPRPLRDGDRVRLGTTTILKFSYPDELEERFQRQMFESARRDGLTGAYNKRYLKERFEAEFAFALRHRTPLSVLLLDLDHFKRINDSFGHLAGDAVLREVARRIQANVRREDVFARYGGEEFVILSLGTPLDGGVRFAERLRRRIAATAVEHEERAIAVSASIGVACGPGPRAGTPTELLEAADAALYRAKRMGRNRVEAAHALRSEPPPDRSRAESGRDLRGEGASGSWPGS